MTSPTLSHTRAPAFQAYAKTVPFSLNILISPFLKGNKPLKQRLYGQALLADHARHLGDVDYRIHGHLKILTLSPTTDRRSAVMPAS